MPKHNARSMLLSILNVVILVRRWAPKYGISRDRIDSLLIWVLLGTIAGARLYFIAQNDFGMYVREPWRILAVWQGGLAFFGGLGGATLAGFLHTRRHGLRFSRVADLFAPAIPIGAAIGRIGCGLAGMDFGTPTKMPWAVLYTHPDSYAPVDGFSRHPTQFYELVGDFVIAAILLKLRGKLRDGHLFLSYLILFSLLRFFLFFVRGDVPIVALGLKNAQWTALVILALALIPLTADRFKRTVPNSLQA
ncbi:MAG: prolipoprotein diacylglyceryl transferase [Bryobacteraceae bacterium]|nr:prolipoprotein diacylglyceryl transferase [Bryobacteraceae bacterium]